MFVAFYNVGIVQPQNYTDDTRTTKTLINGIILPLFHVAPVSRDKGHRSALIPPAPVVVPREHLPQ